MNRAILAFVAGALLLPPSMAIADSDFVFVPFTATGLDGAFGSRWTTESFIFNEGDSTLNVTSTCDLSPCESFGLEPGESSKIAPGYQSPRSLFFFTDGATTDLRASVYTYELTHSSTSWGTPIPVARKSDFRRRTTILNVPAFPSGRLHLRVYLLLLKSMPSAQLVGLRVRVYSFADANMPDRLLAEERLSAIWDGTTWLLSLPDLQGRYPNIGTTERFRVEVQPEVDALVWGFVSGTDNLTQHVTIFQ